MTAAGRWIVVVLGTVVLLGTPIVVRALPVEDPDIGAADLLRDVQGSEGVPYWGYAEAAGSLQLPVTDQFSELASLLGERTRLRVWWRSDDDWRVDAIKTAGEIDLFHSASLTTQWDYEAEEATTSVEQRIRLPRSSDLLPPQLGRLVLRDARPDEVTRIAAEPIAGVEAAGLRLVPAEPQSTIDHVDVWADTATGLPVRVEVYAEGADLPALTTSFLDLTIATPSAERTRFQPPPGAEVDFRDVVDVAGGAQRYAPVTAPRRLAGLGVRPETPGGGAVGEYGRGVTTMVAIPLWDEYAEPLRDQLADTPGVATDAAGNQSLAVGPLRLLLSGAEDFDHSWLVAGTVEHSTLVRAAAQLQVRAVFEDES